jgi:hypothetical protein
VFKVRRNGEILNMIGPHLEIISGLCRKAISKGLSYFGKVISEKYQEKLRKNISQSFQSHIGAFGSGAKSVKRE